MNPSTKTWPQRRLQAPCSALRHLNTATLLLALVGATVGVVQAQPAVRAGDGARHGAHHGAQHGAHHAAHHRMGPGMADGPMMAERALDAVGASAEQKTRVRDIFKAARDDVRQQRDEGRALRQQMMALMAAPQIDAVAAESLRQQQQARHDAASKRWLQAMLDAQAVLTPEQRQKLAERLKARHEMMQRHQRERRSADAPRS